MLTIVLTLFNDDKQYFGFTLQWDKRKRYRTKALSLIWICVTASGLTVFLTVVVKCSRGRRIGTPVRAKGGDVVVLEWQWQEKTQSSRFRKLEPMFHSLCVVEVQEESLQVTDCGWKSCPRSSACTDVLQPCDTADISKHVARMRRDKSQRLFEDILIGSGLFFSKKNVIMILCDPGPEN